MTTESLLAKMLKYDYFHGQNHIVTGIASSAVNNGFDSLSDKQKAVLEPFLAHPCGGVEDPGGNHNNCQKELEDDEFENAITNQAYYGELLCHDCIDETEDYKQRWERIERE